MKLRIIAIAAICLILSACSKPVPNEKSDYVGEWQSKEMYLLILQDGTVSYKRLKNGGSTSVNGPLKEFVGNNFVVGFSFLTTTFDVSEKPTKINNAWEMTVDGIRLTKTDE
ncbi:MAG: hypothetical protein R8K20_10605 [Gallionellaceae bacterium]